VSSQSSKLRSSGGATPPTFHVAANTLQRHQIMEKLVYMPIAVGDLVRQARSIQREVLHSNGRSPVLDGLALFPMHSDELMSQYPARRRSWPDHLEQSNDDDEFMSLRKGMEMEQCWLVQVQALGSSP
jgi:hypothetical protein